MRRYDIKPLLEAIKGKPNTHGNLIISNIDVVSEQRRAMKWMRSRNYNIYLKSYAWGTKRRQVLERDNYCCVLCNSRADHVHHLTYDRIYDESLYDLISLCERCHEAIHWSEE